MKKRHESQVQTYTHSSVIIRRLIRTLVHTPLNRKRPESCFEGATIHLLPKLWAQPNLLKPDRTATQNGHNRLANHQSNFKNPITMVESQHIPAQLSIPELAKTQQRYPQILEPRSKQRCIKAIVYPSYTIRKPKQQQNITSAQRPLDRFIHRNHH